MGEAPLKLVTTNNGRPAGRQAAAGRPAADWAAVATGQLEWLTRDPPVTFVVDMHTKTMS